MNMTGYVWLGQVIAGYLMLGQVMSG